MFDDDHISIYDQDKSLMFHDVPLYLSDIFQKNTWLSLFCQEILPLFCSTKSIPKRTNRLLRSEPHQLQRGGCDTIAQPWRQGHGQGWRSQLVQHKTLGSFLQAKEQFENVGSETAKKRGWHDTQDFYWLHQHFYFWTLHGTMVQSQVWMKEIGFLWNFKLQFCCENSMLKSAVPILKLQEDNPLISLLMLFWLHFPFQSCYFNL